MHLQKDLYVNCSHYQVCDRKKVNELNERVVRSLTIKAFHIDKVVMSDKTLIKNQNLFLSDDISTCISAKNSRIKNISISILDKSHHQKKINTIMDIVPISTKVLGKLGEGITHTLTGVYILLTGADEDGIQMAEFGSSEGILSEQIVFGRAGTPNEDDLLIHIDVTFKSGQAITRELVNNAFRFADEYADLIRSQLKIADGREANEVHKFDDKWSSNKKRVVLVKQVAGQGAMYDNLVFPNEPSGFTGGRSVIDIGNVPIVITPNEYRDGAIRALT